VALGPQDLVLSSMSLARVERGSAAGVPLSVVRAPLEDRCVAAAAGGFAGLGIGPQIYDNERRLGRSDQDIAAMLASYGLVLSELDTAIGLAGPAEMERLRPTVDYLLHITSALRAEQVYIIASPGVPTDELAAGFAWMCDLFAQYGARVGIEFMDLPQLSGLPDAQAALEVVLAAGRDNGGVVVDAYHQVNGTDDWTQLEHLPGDRVIGVQLSDCAVPRQSPDYLEDTMHNRRLPGDGDVDLVRFVRIMDAIGASCPYSLEVISEELSALPAARVGELLGSATRQIFDIARR